METTTKDDQERIAILNPDGYRIYQRRDGFCFGMDAVVLTHFCRVKADDCVLDLGTGTGIIPILLEYHTKGAHFTGLEIQTEVADMARRSVALNHLEEKVSIVTGDICQATSLFPKASFDVVTSNPPYMKRENGLVNPGEARAISRHEVLCTLEDVMREAKQLLKPEGHFFMVHRPRRLGEIFTLCETYGLCPHRLRMVHSFVDKEATMVLLEMVRGGHRQLVVEKPLIIFEKPGQYTPEVADMYYGGRMNA